MFVNPMLSICLYGMGLSLIVIFISLWKWYFKH